MSALGAYPPYGLVLTLSWGLFWGAALGLCFFGGLWLTIRALPHSRRPHLFWSCSLVVRLALFLAGMLPLLRLGATACLGALAGVALVRTVFDAADAARGRTPMNITPDWIVLASWGPFRLNLTIVLTWAVMALLILLARLATRGLVSAVSKDSPLPPLQNALEVVLGFIEQQTADVIKKDPSPYVPFLATLALFIAVSNLLQPIPGYMAPTGSLSTTTALALLVFLAVPWWGIRQHGLWTYLKNYARPVVMMLPFNVIGECSRTLALAVRLFGNLMSGYTIGAILLLIAPVLVPVLMNLLGLLTGLVQAYIFFILAAVYVAAGMETQETQHSNT